MFGLNAGAPPHVVCHKLPVSLGPLCFKRNFYVFSIHFNLKDEQNPQTWGTAMISCSLNKELTWNSFSFVLLLGFWVTLISVVITAEAGEGNLSPPHPSLPKAKKRNFTAVVSPVYCIIWYQTWGFAWRCFNWQMCPSLPLEQVIWNIAEVSCSNGISSDTINEADFLLNKVSKSSFTFEESTSLNSWVSSHCSIGAGYVWVTSCWI